MAMPNFTVAVGYTWYVMEDMYWPLSNDWMWYNSCSRFGTCQPFCVYAVHVNTSTLLPVDVSEVLRKEGSWEWAVTTMTSHRDPARLMSSPGVSHTENRLPARQMVVMAHSSWLSFLGDPTALFLSVTGEYPQPRWIGPYFGQPQVRCWAEELWSPSSPYTYNLKLAWEQMRRTQLSRHHWGPGGLSGSHCLSFSKMRIPTVTLVVL